MLYWLDDTLGGIKFKSVLAIRLYACKELLFLGLVGRLSQLALVGQCQV